MKFTITQEGAMDLLKELVQILTLKTEFRELTLDISNNGLYVYPKILVVEGENLNEL